MTLGHSSSRVAVHLACKVRLAKASFPLFKIPLEPVPLSRGCRVPFHITVPDNIPSTIDHEVLVYLSKLTTIEYRVLFV